MAPIAHPSRDGDQHTFPDVAALYSTLARNLPDGSLVLFDHDLRYIVAGGDEGGILGLAPAGCQGKAVRDVLPPEVAQALEPLYRGALDGRQIGRASCRERV